MKQLWGFAVILLLVAMLAACGGTAATPAATSSPESSGTSTPAATGTSTSGGAGNLTKVTIQNFAFNPSTVSIKAGDSVEWTNMDGTDHTVTSDTWKSDKLANGATFTQQFNDKGTFQYHCSIHPSMTGTVTVE